MGFQLQGHPSAMAEKAWMRRQKHKVVSCIASTVRKQNRKWGQAIKPQGPPLMIHFPGKALSVKDHTTRAFQNITSWGSSVQTHEPVGNVSLPDHNAK